MAFKEDELNQLKLVIGETLEPVTKTLALYEQILHDKDIGLCGRTLRLEDRVADLRTFKRQLIAVVAALQGAGIAVMTWLKN
jgi:hypothetical protein